MSGSTAAGSGVCTATSSRGATTTREKPAAPSSGEEAFPRPIAIVEVLKAALRDKLLDVTEERALVPAHYTVLLHADAYRYLEPAFPVIADVAQPPR